MTASDIMLMWSGNPALSVTVWFTLIVIFLYFSRTPAHRAIRSATRIIHAGLRLAARSVGLAQNRLEQRNKEVLLTAGEEASERLIEREFHRVNAVVARDLSGYPTLHRKINEEIGLIDEYYHQSTDIPPTPPAWIEAVESVAKIPGNGDATVGRILEDIQDSIERSHREAMGEYKKAAQERHKLLRKMLPTWRRVSQQLIDVQGTINGLHERSRIVDRQMEQYEKIRGQSENSLRMLSSSSLTQFFISGIVLVIAVLGGVINFQLIALPMSEMVGGNSYLGSVKMADVAALVIIMIEVAMGLFLMESLRITRLFPVIGTMEDQMRKRMMWTTLAILLVLACVEASLAYMRDLLAADKEALTQSLAGLEIVKAQFRWIPSIGQMVMGFILPFALTFVAIPLESFIQSSRTVLGIVMVGLLRMLAFLLRLTGNAAKHLGDALINIYDIVIFIPLRIEEFLHTRRMEAIAVSNEEKERHSHEIEVG